MNEALLAVKGVKRHFGGGQTWGGLGPARPVLQALRGVNLDLFRGETLGVVGESGCGKSTLAKLVCGLDQPTEGSLRFRSQEVSSLAAQDRRTLARQVQYVFQDPLSALNPRHTVRTALETPLKLLREMNPQERAQELKQLLEAVRLEPSFLERFPHEFSGGQAQRIGIARALAAQAELLVLDEPVSALDVSVQAQVLQLLAQLKEKFQLSYLFISHDLSVVEGVSDRVAVMYFGRIVELGSQRQIFSAPAHPYTKLLLDSAPIPGQRRQRKLRAPAELPDPYRPPSGCAFAARCPHAEERCQTTDPTLSIDGEHQVACHFPLN